jgi:NAD(P)-dependent dehydrogenase (short-subunit alcohol dehydrogenase family)
VGLRDIYPIERIELKKIIVITGASDGIGKEAAHQLHELGHQVVIVGRSSEKTRVVAEALDAPYYIADFCILDDVRKLAKHLIKDFDHIDVLVNNAGGIFGKRELTVDGHEKTMQVNHLAHFLLTNLLIGILIKSKASVINTSSIANRVLSDFDINDIELANKYTSQKAYGNAKLENILFTKELHNRFHDSGINTAAFHPGNVASNFANDTTSFMRYAYHSPIKNLFLIPLSKGAETLVWLADKTGDIDWKSGEYYIKKKISNKIDKKALDQSIQKSLWDQSAKFIELK